MSPDRLAVVRAAAAKGRAARTATALERLEVYGRLRRGGYTIQQAAWELRICRRQAERYEAEIRQHQQKGAA